jgi:hypothetical protein
MVDNAVKADGAPSRRSDHPIVEALNKYLSSAQDRVTTKPTGHDHELDTSSSQWEIVHPALISAVDTPRHCPARWAHAKVLGRTDRDNRPAFLTNRAYDNQPNWHKTGTTKFLGHGADSLSRKQR